MPGWYAVDDLTGENGLHDPEDMRVSDHALAEMTAGIGHAEDGDQTGAHNRSAVGGRIAPISCHERPAPAATVDRFTPPGAILESFLRIPGALPWPWN